MMGATGARSLQPVRGAKPPNTSERGWGPASANRGATGATGAGQWDNSCSQNDRRERRGAKGPRKRSGEERGRRGPRD